MEKKDDCGKLELGDLVYEILDNIPESIMILDREYKIVYANKTLLEVEGVTRGEAIGSCCHKLTHDRDEICAPPDHKCPITEFCEKGTIESFIHKHTDKNSHEFFTEVSAYPIRDTQDDIVGFIHVSRDLSGDIARCVQNIKKIDDSGGDASGLRAKIKQAGL